MLICNNCHTVNENGVERCRHCHMKGNFTHQDDEGRAGDPLDEEAPARPCLNCGTPDAGQGLQCVECHFPLRSATNGRAAGKQHLITKSILHVKEKS